MKLNHLLFISCLALPAAAEETPVPEPEAKPVPPALTPEAVEKLGAVIDAKAEFDRTQAELQTERIESINVDGGMIIALPDPGQDPGKFFNRLKDMTSIQLGGHLNGIHGEELFPPRNGSSAEILSLYARIQTLKTENQMLKDDKGRISAELTVANRRIDWLVKLIERERLAQGKVTEPQTPASR